MTTRQERRAQQRQIRKAGEAILTTGLSAPPPRSDLVALAALMRMALDAGDDGPSQAASLMLRTYEASMAAHPPRLTLACAKGCAYCCHTFVAATAPEIFHAARAVAAKGPAFASAAVGRAARSEGLALEARLGAKIPCAMLVDGQCSIYTSRPAVCRMATSTKVDDCIDEFEGRARDRDITMSKAHVDQARSCRLALAAALRATGRREITYELGPAVARVLATEKAETRWLAGEDIFAGLVEAPAESHQYQYAVVAIAADVRALVAT